MRRNPVARYARQFVRATVQVDQKKRERRGYHKHPQKAIRKELERV